MPRDEYRFQVFDGNRASEDATSDSQYYVFYVEKHDIGDIPIYSHMPTGRNWWHSNDTDAGPVATETVVPSDRFKRALRKIARVDFVTQFIHNAPVTAKGELSHTDLDVAKLPDYEKDVVREVFACVTAQIEMPELMNQYLREIEGRAN